MGIYIVEALAECQDGGESITLVVVADNREQAEVKALQKVMDATIVPNPTITVDVVIADAKDVRIVSREQWIYQHGEEGK